MAKGKTPSVVMGKPSATSLNLISYLVSATEQYGARPGNHTADAPKSHAWHIP
jgi:hypothetical protein